MTNSIPQGTFNIPHLVRRPAASRITQELASGGVSSPVGTPSLPVVSSPHVSMPSRATLWDGPVSLAKFTGVPLDWVLKQPSFLNSMATGLLASASGNFAYHVSSNSSEGAFWFAALSCVFLAITSLHFLDFHRAIPWLERINQVEWAFSSLDSRRFDLSRVSSSDYKSLRNKVGTEMPLVELNVSSASLRDSEKEVPAKEISRKPFESWSPIFAQYQDDLMSLHPEDPLLALGIKDLLVLSFKMRLQGRDSYAALIANGAVLVVKHFGSQLPEDFRGILFELDPVVKMITQAPIVFERTIGS